MFKREMRSKRGSLPPKEGDLTCMHKIFGLNCVILNKINMEMTLSWKPGICV